jgi:hypothetical protein
MAAAQQAGIPLNQGVVNDVANPDASFTFAQPWFYLFQQLWRKLGGQYSTPQNMVYGIQTGFAPNPLVVTFYNVNTGATIGYVILT